MGLFDWLYDLFYSAFVDRSIISRIDSLGTLAELDEFEKSMTEQEKARAIIPSKLAAKRAALELSELAGGNPITYLTSSAIQAWLKTIGQYKDTTPENAEAALSKITGDALTAFAGITASEVLVSKLPWMDGNVIAGLSRKTVSWLGLGAVIAAVAHDPVKIGILRPYQDVLEQTFRNRRPSDVAIFQAYRTRELYSEKAAEIRATKEYQAFAATRDAAKGDVPLPELKIPYAEDVEEVNDAILWRELSRYGYSDEYIASLSRSATITPRFGDMMALARLGLIPVRDSTSADELPPDIEKKWDGKISDFALYSFWGSGYDKMTMAPLLDSVMATNQQSVYGGFRSLVEPSFVENVIGEEDLTAYWNKIGVPEDVQKWVLPRLRLRRQKYIDKESGTAKALQKNLTRGDFVKAYELEFISQATLSEKLAGLGYDAAEIEIIVKLADHAVAGGKAAKCKKLPLSDYELAHKNGLMTTDEVVARMQGEYCSGDIEIERQLLALEDLTEDAPIRERDLSVAQITAAYVDSVIDRDTLISYLGQIGYDEAETSYLAGVADVKRDLALAKDQKDGKKGTITKERDLTQYQIVEAYRLGVESREDTESYLAKLGYDAAEVTTLISIADIKKSMKTPRGPKRLPLADYEKAEVYGLISPDEVVARMQGEYSDIDIGLEKLMLANKIARRG